MGKAHSPVETKAKGHLYSMGKSWWRGIWGLWAQGRAYLREFRERFPERQALSTVRAKGWGVRKGTTISDSRG